MDRLSVLGDPVSPTQISREVGFALNLSLPKLLDDPRDSKLIAAGGHRHVVATESRVLIEGQQ